MELLTLISEKDQKMRNQNIFFLFWKNGHCVGVYIHCTLQNREMSFYLKKKLRTGYGTDII